ncbi:MAG: signal peptidase I [Blautia sp.]|uniref:signal peptidase I n=1 Tax=Blautia glucerasea TaxID=536633 RepID=UPI001570EB9B|nr:signal peptidase I [Blautia glucerasea]NSJ26728.1 signal peptidase I [Blautia glucerasea]
MKQTQEKEKNSLGHKILTGIGIILCVILIPILVINCTLIIKSYTNKDQVPSISGIFPMIILTDSMYPEFESVDLIICNTAEPEEIKVGDVICFYDPAGNGTATVTHRVQEVVTDDEGNLAWITKGDANNTEDLPTVPAKNLIGVYKTRLKGLGNVAVFMQTTQGLIICVICPIIFLVAYDVIRRRAYEKSKKKDTDALLAELEALRAEKEKNNSKDI